MHVLMVFESSLAAGKCAKINLSQAASGMILPNPKHFQCKNRRFRVFEEDFKIRK